jgi:tetratricopeptide (TPR) repeat protein
MGSVITRLLAVAGLSFLAGASLSLLAASPALAQSPLVAELAALSRRYHQDPGRLDSVYAGLSEAVKSDSHPDNMIALAHAAFIWGDVRARTPEEKLEAYDRGRRAGERAAELAPRSALAHLWFAVNAGRWGQTKGVVRSLFLFPTVKEHMEAALALDPGLVPAYVLAGSVYYEVPGLFGGDLDKSESMFKKALTLDPRWTGARVGLARTLAKQGRPAEARREAQTVLGERDPRNPADWTLKDSREARELLTSLGPAR